MPAASPAFRTIPMKLYVEGMTCGHCIKTITRALTALDPAATVAVDLDEHLVHVSGAIDAAAATAAIEDAGYTVVSVDTATAAPAEPKASSCCGSCKA